MYVAKYEDKDGQSLRAFMEAHTIHASFSLVFYPNSWLICTLEIQASVKLDKFQALAISSKHGNPMPTVTTLSQKGKQYDLSNFDQGIEVTDFGNPFRRLNGSFESDNHQRISVEHVEAYLWSLLGVYENIKKLASMGTLDSDEDTRIREMTAKEMAFREQERQQRDETLVFGMLNKFQTHQFLTYHLFRQKLSRKELTRPNNNIIDSKNPSWGYGQSTRLLHRN